ncbi:MAG: ankyrin repeat domain-containing protein, partial [Planctomycetota bacterium]
MIEFPGKVSDFLKIGVAAAARGDIERVREILKQRPKWVKTIGSHGRTMLWEASHRGKLPMVKYLVRRGADINACGSHYTPYFVEVSCYCIARFKNHHDVADFLLDKGAVLDAHTAAFLGDLDELKRQLGRSKKRVNEGHPQYEMDDDAPSGLGYVIAPAPWATPLCYALRGGTVEVASYLIDRGAVINGWEKQLFIAAGDRIEMVRLLLENNADPAKATCLPDDGDLHRLIKSFGGGAASLNLSDELVYLCRGDRGGNPEQVRYLISSGANVNHRDGKGKSALHRAAKSGFVKTTEVLLAAGADVDQEDPGGETPLFETVRSTIKNTKALCEIAKRLVAAGAELDHQNRKSQTAREVARSMKRKPTP